MHLLLREILLGSLGVGLHRVATGTPVGGADLAVLVRELESLHETQSLVHRAANGQIIHRDLAKSASLVDDVETTKSHTVVVAVDAIAARDFRVLVSKKRDVHLAQASFLARQVRPEKEDNYEITLSLPGKWQVLPCQMREVAISRASNELRVDLRELISAIAKSNDFRGAHESTGRTVVTQ